MKSENHKDGSLQIKMNADREDMKKKNRGTVLKLIATGRCSSRIELSREMHLTKTAIQDRDRADGKRLSH